MKRPGALTKVHRVAGAALALGFAAVSIPAAATQQGESGFVAPEAPMLLTRELRRPLPDGKEVVTRRTYEVRFVRVDAGYRIDGKLIDVSVEAPAVLAAIARMEKDRPDEGLFPMHVDESGMLISTGTPEATEAIGRAIAIVSSQLGRMRLATFDRSQAKAFASQFDQRQGLTPWPVDLFRPGAGQRQDIRQIPLPNGARGHVTVDIDAGVTPGSGLLQWLDRTVTTDLEGNARQTFERFSLVARG
ncbi:MAG: hypothetical protein KDE55_04435 [Novosphingobium sp.]|nr:hypothetical protein [Novosphingobium sp.]